jgi:hypothetical protein
MPLWFRAVIPDFYHILQNVKLCEFDGDVNEFHDYFKSIIKFEPSI